MRKEIDYAVKTGVFSLLGDDNYLGELKLDKSNTLIDLTPLPNQEKKLISSPLSQVKGTLTDQTKVTLIDCIQLSSTPSLGKTKIYPHYVVFGEEMFDLEIHKIKSISFIIDDADTIFRDFDAFGIAIEPKDIIQQIIDSNAKYLNSSDYSHPTVPLGSNPQVQFFAGEHSFFNCEDTCFGKIRAFHNTESNFGSTKGVYIRNEIIIEIDFSEPLNFFDSTNRLSILLNFLSLMVGVQQNINDFTFSIDQETIDDSFNNLFKVDWCSFIESNNSKSLIDSRETLIDAVESTNEFSDVLRNWLLRNTERHDSRFRFFSHFCNYQSGIDRLISAANMFDILPDMDIPRKNKTLSSDLKTAVSSIKKILKELDQSEEKESIYRALGRVKTISLKDKIKFRAQKILDHSDDIFPDLFSIIDKAVDCRNYYVHGSKPSSSIEYDHHPQITIFFTETLEFIYAVSDLIESGWDFHKWVASGSAASHPFGYYRIYYRQNYSYTNEVFVSENQNGGEIKLTTSATRKKERKRGNSNNKDAWD